MQMCKQQPQYLDRCQAQGLTIQFCIVFEVHILRWLLPAADEAVLVLLFHVPIQLVAIIKALLAEAAVWMPLEPAFCHRSCIISCSMVPIKMLSGIQHLLAYEHLQEESCRFGMLSCMLKHPTVADGEASPQLLQCAVCMCPYLATFKAQLTKGQVVLFLNCLLECFQGPKCRTVTPWCCEHWMCVTA